MFLTGLWRMARRRTQTTDNDMGQFREKLNELVEKKDSFSDEDVAKRVDGLKELTIDLPDNEDKEKLSRFLEDFKSVKEQDGAAAKDAAGMVADLFEKLDTEAMKDTPDAGGEEAATEGATAVEEPPAQAETTETAETAVEETTAPDGEGKAEDADPNPEYSLEEIYQFVKKRMAEDCGTSDGGEEVEEEKKEEKKEEVVTDHAPHIPVTMNGTPAAKGSLAEMFDRIKEGGR